MAESITDVIKLMVEQMLKSSFIRSPRFEDYKIVDVRNGGDFPNIDEIVKDLIKELVADGILKEEDEEIKSSGVEGTQKGGLLAAKKIKIAAQNPVRPPTPEKTKPYESIRKHVETLHVLPIYPPLTPV